MSFQTVPVTCVAKDPRGNPIAGAIFEFLLATKNAAGKVIPVTEIYQGLVVPEKVIVEADDQGQCVVALFPNELGVRASQYLVTATNPEDDSIFLYGLATFPNTPCNLHEVLDLLPIPPLDAAQAAVIQVQAIQTDVNASKGQVDAAHADVTAMHAEVMEVKDSTEANLVLVAQAQTEIEEIKNAAEAVQADIDTKAAQVADDAGAVSQAKDGVLAIQTDVVTRSDEVAEAHTDIMALAPKVTAAAKQAPSVQNLVDGASIVWDIEQGKSAFLTLSTVQATRKLENLQNAEPGAIYAMAVKQHPSSNQQITVWGNQITPLANPSVDSAANSTSIFLFLSTPTGAFVVRTGVVGNAPAPAPSPNQAPLNAITSAVATAYQTPYFFSAANGNAITVSDADGGNLTTTLSIPSAAGILTATTGTGAALTTNGTATVVVQGTIAQVNAALDGLKYTPAAGYSGNVALQVSTTDGITPDVDTITITVHQDTSQPILFGSRADGAYPYGALPTLVTTDATTKAAADASILAHFQKLVDHHVVGKDIAPGLPDGGLMPRFYGAYGDAWYSADATFKMGAVSEGFGYWLIMCAIMHGAAMGNYPAGHPKAGQARPTPKQIFDGMLKTVLARPAYQYKLDNPNNPNKWMTDHLMEWSLNGNANPLKADGTPAAHGGVIGASNNDAYSAPDGDLDIALGLDMGARQWPNDPTYDYADLAKKRVTALKWWHYWADGTGLALKKPYGYGSDATPFYMVRLSDFMFNHYRSFATLTDDPFWMGAATTGTLKAGNVYDRQLALLKYTQDTFSPGVGLVPDFIESVETGTPILPQHKPGHGDAWLIQPDATTGTGYFNHTRKLNSNSVRVQLRYVIDYLFSGNPEVKAVTDKLNDFFSARITARGGVGGSMASAYMLDGTPSYPSNNNVFTPPGGDLAELLGSVLAGLCTDAKYATNLNLLWRWCRGDDGGRMDGGYYAGELEFMGRLVAAGLWWTPRMYAAIPTGTSLPAPAAPAPAPTPAPSPAPTPAPTPAPSPAPAPSDGVGVLTAAGTAGKTLFWGDPELAYLYTTSAGSTSVAAFGTTSSPTAGGLWKSRDATNAAAGRNLVQTDLAKRFNIYQDTVGKAVDVWSPTDLVGMGGSTTEFYSCSTKDDKSYQSTLFSDGSLRLHYFDGRYYAFEVNTSAGLKSVQTVNVKSFAVARLQTVETRIKAGKIGIRLNKTVWVETDLAGATVTQGNADLRINSKPDGTAAGSGPLYSLVVGKQWCPATGDDDLIATMSAAEASVVI